MNLSWRNLDITILSRIPRSLDLNRKYWYTHNKKCDYFSNSRCVSFPLFLPPLTSPPCLSVWYNFWNKTIHWYCAVETKIPPLNQCASGTCQVFFLLIRVQFRHYLESRRSNPQTSGTGGAVEGACSFWLREEHMKVSTLSVYPLMSSGYHMLLSFII